MQNEVLQGQKKTGTEGESAADLAVGRPLFPVSFRRQASPARWSEIGAAPAGVIRGPHFKA